MAMLVIVTVVWLGIGFRLWRRRLWLGFRTGCGRLWLRRWAGFWLRRRNTTGRQGQPTTAALRAFWGQGQDKAPIYVRRAGGQGQDQEKVFHHSLSNLAKAENDLRYDFIKRSICSTFHLLGSIRVSSSSR
jgi:hypothetical protein